MTASIRVMSWLAIGAFAAASSACFTEVLSCTEAPEQPGCLVGKVPDQDSSGEIDRDAGRELSDGSKGELETSPDAALEDTPPDVAIEDTLPDEGKADDCGPQGCAEVLDCGHLTSGCVLGVIVDGACTTVSRPNGFPCDDDDACTQIDSCQQGSCVGADPVECTSTDPCLSAGTCDPAAGTCSDPEPVDGGSCDDGLACTIDDICEGGLCVGQPIPCPADPPCASASCVEGVGCITDASQCECVENYDCGSQHVCSGGACVCVPDCDAKACGPDGCGGSCGSCAVTEACKASTGECVCQPDCAGKQCGDSGCGTGQCGICPAGLTCESHQCVKPVCGQLDVPCPDGFMCSAAGSCEGGGDLYVPAGDFWMGCNAEVDSYCSAKEKPQHLVSLDAFAIQKTEVTVAQYKSCVEAGACTSPSDGGGALLSTYWVAGGEQLPVNFVTHAQATSFCNWAGKRLPTEAEWEKAARGGCSLVAALPEHCAISMPLFAWGNETVTCELAVMDDDGDGCGTDGPLPVGSKPAGASPYGALDMVGNLGEMVSDWYGATYYVESPVNNPQGPGSGSANVVRGGSYVTSAQGGLRAGNRTSLQVGFALDTIGFRCARSVP